MRKIISQPILLYYYVVKPGRITKKMRKKLEATEICDFEERYNISWADIRTKWRYSEMFPNNEKVKMMRKRQPKYVGYVMRSHKLGIVVVTEKLKGERREESQDKNISVDKEALKK